MSMSTRRNRRVRVDVTADLTAKEWILRSGIEENGGIWRSTTAYDPLCTKSEIIPGSDSYYGNFKRKRHGHGSVGIWRICNVGGDLSPTC